MVDTSNSSVNAEVGNNEGGSQVTDQTTATDVDVVKKQDYIKLQSEATRWRQEQIATTAKLVEKDINELKDIRDDKLRDAVVKQLFNYSSYDEMVAIEGNDFSRSSKNGGNGEDEDTITVLQKQLKQLSYQNERRELESAIAGFKSANPNLFATEEAEVELREKLKYIAVTDVNERVKLAAKIAFSGGVDPTTAAYKDLSKTQINTGGSPSGTNVGKTEKDRNVEDVLSFLKLK